MNRDDIVHILCRLTSRFHDFENEQSTFDYEFQDRLYDVTFSRLEGKLDSFTIEYVGEVLKCEKSD